LFGSHPSGFRHLWSSNGTSSGTLPLVRLAPPGPDSVAGNPTTMLSADGVMYVAGDNGANGMELWRSDGTPYGTTLVADLAPGAASSNPAGFALVGNTLYFTADNGMYGRELWALDVSPSTLPGDVNNDLNVDGRDIDQVIRAVAAGDVRAKYDLNGDGGVDALDTAYLVRMVLGSEFGDANLDGAVDDADFSIVAGNYASAGAGWNAGDFNGDGRVSILDAIVWRDHRAEPEAVGATSAAAIVAAVNRGARVHNPASPLRAGAPRRMTATLKGCADAIDIAMAAVEVRDTAASTRTLTVRGRRR
jgi:ELWxxDGT repeat protein